MTFFFQNAVFSLGDGRRVNFWKDAWCGEDALCSVYPSFFNLAIHKEATVVTTQIWGIMTGAREWEGIKPPKPVASLTENTYTNYHAITCQNVNISI